jgi:hypothetical protein
MKNKNHLLVKDSINPLSSLCIIVGRKRKKVEDVLLILKRSNFSKKNSNKQQKRKSKEDSFLTIPRTESGLFELNISVVTDLILKTKISMMRILRLKKVSVAFFYIHHILNTLTSTIHSAK